MKDVTDEIDKAIVTLGLNESDLRQIVGNEYESLINEFIDKFVERRDQRWWWEAFKIEPVHSITSHPTPYDLLESIVPDADEKLWFVVENTVSPSFLLYESCTRVIVEVIRECFGFEYYLIAKDKQWLLCENHHTVLIGVGKQIESAFLKHAT